ncbi:MAG: ubiquitin-like domain-containing protein [Acutalibacteraceae bacterium]|nr:ubiquitin-like domain-containing protein [Acutalibacteraceae bacterium]
MITNSASGSNGKHSKRFRILSAVVAGLFTCSVTLTASGASETGPVTVVDGEKSVSISAASGSPREIVKQAGIVLNANDELDLSGYDTEEGGTIVIDRAKVVRVEDNGFISYLVGYAETIGEVIEKEGIELSVQDDIGVNSSIDIYDGMQVFIKRAFTVKIIADGETHKAYITDGTVADALEEAGITLGEDDTVYPSLDAELSGFTEIKVSRVTFGTSEETQEIDYNTEVIYSDEMKLGDSKIVTPGVKGKKTVYYVDKFVDGELEKKTVSSEKVIEKPVNEVKMIGTMPANTLKAYKNTGAPISELSLPKDVELDENGIPVNYTKRVEAKATAYTGDPATSTGRKPIPGHIAVDPNEYPYGTELYIVSADGSYVYGYCIAADTGGFVEMGNTDVDLYLDNADMCYNWGNRDIVIYVLN